MIILKLHKYFSVCFILLFTFGLSYAQTIEDLQAELLKTKDDSIKIDLLLSIAEATTNNNTAIDYALKAKQLAEKNVKPYSKIYTYYSIGNIYNRGLNDSTAYTYYKLAIATAIQIKDEKLAADIYSDMASIYRENNVLDSSLYFNFKALDLRKKLGSKNDMAISYHNIGLVYRKKNDWDNALLNYQKSLQLFAQLNDDKHVCKTLTNIGVLYKNKLIYDSVFIYFNRAKPLAKKNNDEYSLYQINLNTALCYNELNRYAESEKILLDLYKDERLKGDDDYPWLLYGLGVSSMGLKQYEKGIDFLQKASALTYKKSNWEFKGSVYLVLADAYEKKGNYQLAYQHYKTYRTYSDSLYSKKNTENVNQLFASYKTKEKEQEIVLLNKENQLKDLSIKEKQRTNLLYALGLVLISIVAIGILYLYKNKQKVSRQLEEKNKIISVSLKEKEVLLKEIHHRVKNNLQVISSLLNLQSKSISDEKALLALNEGRNRVKSMALIHQNLYRDDNLMGVDVRDYIEKLVSSLFTSYNIEPNKIILKTNIDDIQLDVDTVIPLGLILNELISNALKYAFENRESGLLEVALKLEDDGLLLRVKDDGKGIDNDDLNKNNSASMGHKLVQSFLQKLSASMTIEKQNGTNIELLIKKFKVT